MDKLLIVSCGDIPFDTRPAGALYVEDGVVKFDHNKTFNAARRIINKCANIFIVERFAMTSWTPPAAVAFDWESPGYFELLRQYVETIHRPVQGESTLQGIPVVISFFIGACEYWMYLPENYDKARLLMQKMFATFKDLSYVQFCPGREMNAKKYPDGVFIDQGTIQAFMDQVVYPEFEAAGKALFAYGACYATTDPPYNGDLEQQKALYERKVGEERALTVFRKIHGVADSKSKTLLETMHFWFEHANPNHPLKIDGIFSVDGVGSGAGQGESDIDFITLSNGTEQHRPSGEQMKDAIRYVVKNSARVDNPDGTVSLGFEYMSKAMTMPVVETQLQAIAEVYFELFGEWPEYFGKLPNDWVEPVVPPVIVDPPVVPPLKFNLWGWIKNRKWWIALLIVFIVLAILIF